MVKRLQYPLLMMLLIASNITVAQVETNIASNDLAAESYTCQLTVRDLAKEDTYSASTKDNLQNEWLLVRINGDEPSKSEQNKFRKITSDYQPVYTALSGNDVPNSLRLDGKKFQAQLVEKGAFNQPKKATYVTKDKNSTKHKLEVFYSHFNAATSLVEKIEYTIVNTRNNFEETEMVLSYFNYRKIN